MKCSKSLTSLLRALSVETERQAVYRLADNAEILVGKYKYLTQHKEQQGDSTKNRKKVIKTNSYNSIDRKTMSSSVPSSRSVSTAVFQTEI